MKLPEHISENHSIDEDKDRVTVGDYLYHVPSDKIQYITDSGPISFELVEKDTKKHWKVSGQDMRENLFDDFYPLKLTGYYPD